ncbi:MAG TPA: tetratricopeptide repeat protein [Thermoanaerobaculaceae bacterium]|nr:tetratricopeptide repeat protein [Thermoanaerobaculaceae bacterium]
MKKKPPSPARSPWRREWLLPAGLILALTCAAYVPALSAGFVWDDDVYVTANPHLHDAAGLVDIWARPGSTVQYYPLVFTSFWVQYHLWGTNPLGYHLVNIALHGLGAILLWIFLGRLAVPGRWLAAAVFAVHPVCVESVTWVSELKNVQSLVLGLLCLLAFFHFDPADTVAGPECWRRWRFHALALLLFAASLLTKPALVALPLVILLIIWWRRGRLVGTDVTAVAPMLAMSLAMGLVTMHAERVFSGASGAAWQMPFSERVLVAGRALWFYVGKLVWPSTLVSIYPRWEVASGASWQLVAPVAAAAALLALWSLRGRIGRGPVVAAGCFVVIVSPTIGLFEVSYHLYSFVADHFQYHAAPALIALFAATMTGIAERSRHRVPVLARNAAAAVLLLGLVARTWQHTRIFQSEKLRCQDTIAHNPGAWLAMNNLGVALAREGNLTEAIRSYQDALRIRPDYAEAHDNIGVALVRAGHAAEAIPHYREALRIWPTHAETHNNLGAALAGVGKTDEAVGEYREALRLRPGYTEARTNLGTALVSQGKSGEAIAQYEAALRDAPDSAAAHNNLGLALVSEGRIDEAVREYREAIRSTPDFAETHNNLAAALVSGGNRKEAIPHLREALRLKPNYAEALYNLGTALAAEGALDEAVGRYREALRLRPDYAEAHHNLGTALASQGHLAGAIAEYREAVRIRPDYAEAHQNLGMALASEGRIGEASDEFREVLRAQPDNVMAHNNLGAALASLGQLAGAVSEFEQALRLDPSNAATLHNLQRARTLATERRVPGT